MAKVIARNAPNRSRLLPMSAKPDCIQLVSRKSISVLLEVDLLLENDERGKAGRRREAAGKDPGRSERSRRATRQVRLGFLRHPQRGSLLHEQPAALRAPDALAVDPHKLGRLQFRVAQRANCQERLLDLREVDLGAGHR